MDLSLFTPASSGRVVPISGTDADYGTWQHHAFVPDPLPSEMPNVATQTHLRIADARAAVATLDSTARQLDNPGLLRHPTLRREAQSTSALEGTYAPLSEVLTAGAEDLTNQDLREIINYVEMADAAYASVMEGHPLTVPMLCEMQARLVHQTRHEGRESGQVRSIQVVVGTRPDVASDQAPIFRSRYVPPPPGVDLRAQLNALLEWKGTDHRSSIDPVAKAAMAHYQFETIHPFHDGNGRLGRLLMTIDLLTTGILSEPTLSVSPWFEARRDEYYDRLLAVSTDGDWNGWLEFFARGLTASASSTQRQMLELVEARDQMRGVVSHSALRAGTAYSLVDLAVANPSFTVRRVEHDLDLSYGRANRLVEQLVGLGILAELPTRGPSRRFYAPTILDILTRR